MIITFRGHPLPHTRAYDWGAYDSDIIGTYGWGASEDEAVQNLRLRLETGNAGGDSDRPAGDTKDQIKAERPVLPDGGRG